MSFIGGVEVLVSIPEPSTATLLTLGLAGIAAGRRRTAARSHDLRLSGNS
jgi:hypothetical protein